MRWSRNYFPPNEVPEAKKPNLQPLIPKSGLMKNLPETNILPLKIHPWSPGDSELGKPIIF